MEWLNLAHWTLLFYAKCRTYIRIFSKLHFGSVYFGVQEDVDEVFWFRLFLILLPIELTLLDSILQHCSEDEEGALVSNQFGWNAYFLLEEIWSIKWIFINMLMKYFNSIVCCVKCCAATIEKEVPETYTEARGRHDTHRLRKGREWEWLWSDGEWGWMRISF